MAEDEEIPLPEDDEAPAPPETENGAAPSENEDTPLAEWSEILKILSKGAYQLRIIISQQKLHVNKLRINLRL